MPADTHRVQSVFLAAVEVADVAARAAMLDRACGPDQELRRRVEALLLAYDDPARITDHPALTQDGAASEAQRGSGHAPAESPGKGPQATRNIRGKNDGPEDRQDGPDPMFLEPPSRPGAIGRLGHYEVLEVLGQGGFGIVMKAFDDVLHRVVAVKMMSPNLAAASPARKRFLREARAAAAVRHDNVVQIYAVEEKPIPYLVMEFIPGETVQQLVDAIGPLELREVLRIGSQVARGLEAAHETGLIHRDIKPDNILVESGLELRARLTDFGLARAADDASLTQSGMVAGTPMYMAPEQARGEQLDHRADLFSLGSVLYAMVSGRPPFRAANSLAVLKRVCEDTPRPIQEIIPEVEPWLCEVIAKLHAKDPARRFQTAREVADLLSDGLKRLRQNGKPGEPAEKPRDEAPPAAPAPAAAADRVPARRGWWRWAAVALLPLVAVGIVKLTGATQRDARSEPDRPPPAAAPSPASTSPSAATTTTTTTTTGAPTATLVLPLPPLPPLPPFPFPQPDRAPEGPRPKRFQNDLGMEFVLIPKGRTWLGGGGGSAGSDEVEIPNDFYLGVYEVTQGQWEKLMGKDKNPSRFSRAGKSGQMVEGVPDEELKRFPVDSVSWDDCQEFLKRLNKKTSERGWKYRLPTSKEWEYACRGGSTASQDDARFDFYLDQATNVLPTDRANFKGANLKRTCRVGSYPPNRLGLHDMHGNVFELCDDIAVRDGESLRVLRGGGWHDGAELCTASNRSLGVPSAGYNGSGLRVARVLADR